MLLLRNISLMLLLVGLLPISGAKAQSSSNTCEGLGPANTYPVSATCVPLPMNKPASYTATYTATGCGADAFDEAWARFTATHANTFVQYTATSGNAVMHIYSGSCGALTLVGCVNNFSGGGSGESEAIELATVVGQSYIIRIQRVTGNGAMNGKLCLVGFVPPVNDHCASAPLIGAGSTAFSSYGATGSDITSCTANDTKDVWFRHTAVCTGNTTVSTCGTVDYNSALAIFNECGGTELACNAYVNGGGCTGGRSKVTFAASAGITYWIRVSGDNGAVGAGTLDISCRVLTDLCASASPIHDGATLFSTSGMTGTDVTSCGTNDYKDLWMRYTATCAGEVVMSTCGVTFNSTLAAFSACGGTEIVCNNDDPACGVGSTITFNALPGEQFLIRISGIGGASGGGTLTTACNQVLWYSRASGNVSDPIWSRTMSGDPGPAVFNEYSSVIVQAGHSVTQDVPTLLTRRLLILSGGTYAMGANDLDMIADLEVEGTLLPNTGTLRMMGSSKQLLTNGTVQALHNFTLDNPSGLELMAPLDITGSLRLRQGEFHAGENTVRLVSNANGTARLGQVGATATYTGNLMMERYVPAGATNWRLLSVPVAGRNINNWQDDFITAGFPGSHFPNFTSGGQPWPSVRHYVEPTPGGQNVGMVGPVSVNDPLAPGYGFQVWSGSSLTTTTAFTIDVAGAPVFAKTPFALPVTWTNTGNVEGDGWNLVGNPVASPIDFTTMARGADVRNMFWIFDPEAGSMAFWNETLQTGSAGMTGNIQSSQAFWLKADGPDNVVSVLENDKVTESIGGLFGGSRAEGEQALVRLRLTDLNSERYAEAMVHFGAGEPGADAMDMGLLEFDLGGVAVPTLATLDPSGRSLVLNAHGNDGSNVNIPVQAKSGAVGMHRIEIMELGSVGLPDCMILEDLLTGERIPVQPGAILEFLITGTEPDNGPRFRLVGASPMAFAQGNATCNGNNDGFASVQGDDNWTYAWRNAAGAIIGNAASINGLAVGTYELTVNGDAACPERVRTFTIAAPAAIEATAHVIPANCAATTGSIDLNISGGTAPYTALWSNGSTGLGLTNAVPGTYAVAILDAAGCSRQFNGLVVETSTLAGNLEVPATVAVNVPVAFASTVSGSFAHTWDFGDGASSAALAPVHAYEAPGLYTVSLTLAEGNCTRILTTTVEAGISTGIEAFASGAVEAYSTPTDIVLKNVIDGPLTIWLHDLSGRTIDGPRVLAAGTPRWERGTADLTPGTYILQAHSNGRHWTFKLPVVR